MATDILTDRLPTGKHSPAPNGSGNRIEPHPDTPYAKDNCVSSLSRDLLSPTPLQCPVTTNTTQEK